MTYQVMVHTGEMLDFTTVLPTQLKKNQVFPNILYSSGQWGEIFYQIFPQEGFTALNCNFKFNEKGWAHTIADLESVTLHIAYKNDFIKHCQLGRLLFNEGNFNVVYLPILDIKTEFTEPGEYKCFDVRYSKEYLQRFIPYISGLDDFLSKEKSSIYSPNNPFATPAMLRAVDNIMQHTYQNDVAKFYLESKALELLTLAFEKLDQKNFDKSPTSPVDLERIKDVRKWIDGNFENPGTLREIAMRFGTNEYKLKRDFKAIVGLPVFDYLLKIKLGRAEKSLMETALPINQIAYDIGYSNPAHFSRAFKKEFSVSPKYMRKHK